MTVAALYVETGGAYFGLPGVDPYDVGRDARLYAGPHPVVAHPPCQLWVNMAGVNFKRHGGPHNRPGNDGGCFAAAFEAVKRYGGVLEHPAETFAWSTFGLRRPGPRVGVWVPGNSGWGSWVAEVWQSSYGHPARKRTWLFVSGVELPPKLDERRDPGTHQVGWFDRKKPTLSKREANATPPAFRDLLLSIARSVA
jgi:hypothetical protein